MAGVDVRNSLPDLPPAQGRPMSPERVEALREAQRAFFKAALSGETPASATPATVAPKVATAPAAAAAPDGRLRPGSLVDIKV